MIKLQVASLEEVSEFLRPLISEENGVFSIDDSQLKTVTDVNNVLQAKEHVNNELKDFKALNKTAEELKALLNAPATKQNDADVTQSAEYLTLQKAMDDMKNAYEPMKQEFERTKAEKEKFEIKELVKNVINGLDDKFDKERLTAWTDDASHYFKKNAINELEKIGDKNIVDFLTEKATNFNFIKPSTPNAQSTGNANPQTKNAKPSGNATIDALRNAPITDI